METSSSYESTLTKLFATVPIEIASTEWKSDNKTKFYELFTRLGGDSYKMVKVTGTYDASPLKAKDFIFDPTTLVKYDDSKESRVELEAGSNWKVFFTKGAKFFMVDPRDTVIVIGFKIESNGKIIIAGCSVEHQKAPQVKGRVRAFCEIMGYVLEPVEGNENKCTFTYIGKLDPKGSVPAMMVNKMIAKQGEVVMVKLNEVLKKY